MTNATLLPVPSRSGRSGPMNDALIPLPHLLFVGRSSISKAEQSLKPINAEQLHSCIRWEQLELYV